MLKTLKSAVYNLCILDDKLVDDCAQSAYNHIVIRRARNVILSCTHFLHTLTHLLITGIFSELTSLKDHLYTLSTQPIITIYLYKGDYKI